MDVKAKLALAVRILTGLLGAGMKFVATNFHCACEFYKSLLAKVVSRDEKAIKDLLKQHMDGWATKLTQFTTEQGEWFKRFPKEHSSLINRVMCRVALLNMGTAVIICWGGIAVRGATSVWGISHLISLTEMSMDISPLLGFILAMLVFVSVVAMPVLLSVLFDIAVLLWFPMVVLGAEVMTGIGICALVALGALLLCIALPVNALMVWARMRLFPKQDYGDNEKV